MVVVIHMILPVRGLTLSVQTMSRCRRSHQISIFLHRGRPVMEAGVLRLLLLLLAGVHQVLLAGLGQLPLPCLKGRLGSRPVETVEEEELIRHATGILAMIMKR